MPHRLFTGPVALFGALLTFSVSAQEQGINVIPRPAAMTVGSGSMTLIEGAPITYTPSSLSDEADFLREALVLFNVRCTTLPEAKGSRAAITLRLSTTIAIPPEGYLLHVTADSAELVAADEAGIFHGVQTLLQLVRRNEGGAPALPVVLVQDNPRFAWRGMHLDVCRHFFPVWFVKRYIDLLARYKMNRFHWHLTEDQGWRIEIKQYPKLTGVGAWRSGSQVGPYSDRAYDSTRYGGFYTQQEIREVVAYAAARHVTIVPEIELPGHSLAALSAYPELSCTGGPFEVAKGWGVFDDVYCPKEETFTFLENVLAEVIALFPGEYIHIGGDECPKTRWKECAHCQALIQREGLKDEHELQSYFIRRIERYVNSKGRKIIGWDEILEGGLAPNAAVMSWRGTEGGMAAARAGHHAVMTPGSHCYFDHYQGDPAQEPLAIGGYTTVQKVYGYEPVPDSLTAEQAKYILGAQGNVWTEYILDERHVEYMAVPRMLALSEVLWSPKEARDETDFLRRLRNEFTHLDGWSVNYSRSLYQAQIALRPAAGPGVLVASARCAAPGMHGRIMATDVPGARQMTDSVLITSSTGLWAAAYDSAGVQPSAPTEQYINWNMATARAITCDPPPNERYDDGGAFTLVNGVVAGPRRVNYEWLGWSGGEVMITIDLGSRKGFSHIDIGALDERTSWIHLPEEVLIGVADDPAKVEFIAASIVRQDAKRVSFSAEGSFAGRYVVIRARAVQRIPTGFAGEGQPAWMFLDEVTVQ